MGRTCRRLLTQLLGSTGSYARRALRVFEQYRDGTRTAGSRDQRIRSVRGQTDLVRHQRPEDASRCVPDEFIMSLPACTHCHRVRQLRHFGPGPAEGQGLAPALAQKLLADRKRRRQQSICRRRCCAGHGTYTKRRQGRGPRKEPEESSADQTRILAEQNPALVRNRRQTSVPSASTCMKRQPPPSYWDRPDGSPYRTPPESRDRVDRRP